MRRWRLVAAATVSSGVLAGGMFAAFNLTASAATNTCAYTPPGGTTTVAPSCTITGYTVTNPVSVTFGVNTTPGGVTVTLNWSVYCTDSAQQNTSTVQGTDSLPIPAGSGTGSQSATFLLQNSSLPLSEAASCTFTTVSATEVTATPTGGTAPPVVTALGLAITYTGQPAASPTPSPTPTTTTSTGTVTHYNNQVHGFDGTCLDDKGNKSAERTAVILWSCNNTDQAQGWTYSGSELKIHGMCLNAKGSGTQGSHLILWTCNGAGNEIFTHRSNGEFAEKANGYKYCIDDPAYSTKNGTQPFMYTCNNGGNQHFTKP